jgi:hypothetical protein
MQASGYSFLQEIGLYPGSVTVNGVAVLGSPMNYHDGKVKITLGGTIVSIISPLRLRLQ